MTERNRPYFVYRISYIGIVKKTVRHDAFGEKGSSWFIANPILDDRLSMFDTDGFFSS